MRRVLLPGLLVSVGLLAGCGGGSSDATAATSASAAASGAASPTAGAIQGLRVLAQDPSHDHVTTRVDYPDAPPLGGKHNPRWLACDVYDQSVPDEFAVHSMEHGGVWLTYRPGLPADQVARLVALEKTNTEYVLVSPYEGLTTAVEAVTWGRSLQVDSAEDPRLAQFVQQFAGGGQGGEQGAPCRTKGVTLREARAMLTSG